MAIAHLVDGAALGVCTTRNLGTRCNSGTAQTPNACRVLPNMFTNTGAHVYSKLPLGRHAAAAPVGRLALLPCVILWLPVLE